MKIFLYLAVSALAFISSTQLAAQQLSEMSRENQETCESLFYLPNLTITSAELREANDLTPSYCYVRGSIRSGIQYHAQLPLPENWNGRFLKMGDGGNDGDLDFSNLRVAQGYAVANSNMGHDNGTESGASFAFNNRQSEIDYGYRAVHLTTNAGKSLVEAYYGEDPAYSYFEGCSTGGREGLMEAQRYPDDFDGIVAGDPVNYLQTLNAMQFHVIRQFYKDNFAGNPAYDVDGDGLPESLAKMGILEEAVLAKCDANDGIRDGVIDNPYVCDFNLAVDLDDSMCPGSVNGNNCFTPAQIEAIQVVYDGARDSQGNLVYKGFELGSEPGWASQFIPHASNNLRPGQLDDFLNYLFYEEDPGVAVPDLTDIYTPANTAKLPPEWHWWNFSFDDVTAGKGDFMKAIIEAADPDLRPFLVRNNGKLILYHGWRDPIVPPAPTVDYFEEVIDVAFQGNADAARERIRLFMAPGMNHCGGGPGPNTWDKLSPLVEWVENGNAPDFVVATHATNGEVDNERKLCPHPQQAVYTGPAGGQNDPANWVGENFSCR